MSKTMAYFMAFFAVGLALLASAWRAWRGRWLVVGALILGGCTARLDLARRDFTVALQVAHAAQVRLKAYDAQHQLDLVRQTGGKDAARAALATYRARRAKAIEQAARTEAVMDATADVLLIGSPGESDRAAADARSSALVLREAVDALIRGNK